jgi:ATP-dependent helicase/nuclease subunit B
MKAIMSLEPPERRLGLAAHDFEMAMGAPSVFLTRAMRSGDAPAVASRWLQRIEALIGEEETKGLKAKGGSWLDWTRALNGEPGSAEPAPRPRPAPKSAGRPKAYSVTDIETLIRDPYAVYARKVLRIASLEPLVAEYGPRERGSLIHEVLEHAVRDGFDPKADTIQAELVRIADTIIADWEIPADIVALWRPRIVATLAEFLEWEASRDYDIARRMPETVSYPVPVENTGVTLHARADRIDILRGGMGTIVDYKTGSTPSAKQAHILISPQLPLEAALMQRGGFAEAGARKASDLIYLRLKADGSLDDESILEATVDRVKSIKSAPQLAVEAWEKLVALVRYYGEEKNGFISRRMPFKESEEGDYDHLARVREWTSASENGGGGE